MYAIDHVALNIAPLSETPMDIDGGLDVIDPAVDLNVNTIGARNTDAPDTSANDQIQDVAIVANAVDSLQVVNQADVSIGQYLVPLPAVPKENQKKNNLYKFIEFRKIQVRIFLFFFNIEFS